VRVTFQFVKNVYKKTGVNVTGLDKNGWFKTDPEVQIMIINEYRLSNKKPLLKEGEIPDDFVMELVEAVNFFIAPSKEGTDTSHKSTLSSEGSAGAKKT